MFNKMKLIPREEMVTYLDIPDDIVVSTDIWRVSDSALSTLASQFDSLDDWDKRMAGNYEIGPPLTDSEEDYELIEMIRNKGSIDPWVKMREVFDRFPSDYIASLKTFEEDNSKETLDSTRDITDTISYDTFQYFDDEFKHNVKKFIDEECSVFTADDPSLKSLEDVLKRLGSKGSPSTSDADSIEDAWWRQTFSYSEFSISPPGEHLHRALARDIDYELPSRKYYNEERCNDWVEDNFLRRMENL